MSKDLIRLQLPKKSEYISVARLAISGLAYGIDFDIGNIEDMKVCLGEACINALSFSGKEELNIEFEVKKDRINIRVEDVKDTTSSNSEGSRELKLGMLIIESLMDEVIIDDSGIEMVKYIEDDIQ